MSNRVISFAERGLAPASRVLNNIGIGVIVAMILITIADVIGRRFFNQCITGAHEIQQFCFMTACFFTWAHCQMRGEHISVTFIADLLPRRLMVFVHIITSVIATCVYSILVWRLVVQSLTLKRFDVLTSELRIPEWPFLAVTGAVGVSLFALTLALAVSQRVAEAAKK